MRIQIIIFFFVFVLTSAPMTPPILRGESDGSNLLSDEKTKEERKIIEMLDMLENYDLIKSMQMFSNMDEIKNINTNEAGNEAGKKEVEQ